MRQRAAIAMALSCNPRILIADEPTTALDVMVQAQILALLDSLCRDFGLALLLVTHDLPVVAQTCSRAAVMYAGQVVEQGPAAPLLHDPLHPYTRALLQCAPSRPSRTGKKRRAYIPGSPPDMQQVITACAFESRCPDRMEICTIRPPQELKQETFRHVRCFKYGG
jgi:oligopeptide/dipeptide ABC transporter ATP-binding protein